MLGLINQPLVEFVRELHGEAAVRDLRRSVEGGQDRFEIFLEYPSSTTEVLLNFVAKLRGLDRDFVLDDLGTFAMTKLWGSALRDLALNSGADFEDFLRNLPHFLKAISFLDERWAAKNVHVRYRPDCQFDIICEGASAHLAPLFQGMLRAIADEFEALVLIERFSQNDAALVSIKVFDEGQSHRYILNNNDPEYFELFVRANLLQVIFEEAKGSIARLDGTRALAELAATTDPLTGLLNRRGLAEWWGIHAKAREMIAIAMLDLDRFKPINDQHGHAVGDAVLKAVSQRLQNQFRDQDAVARIGGDEFAIIFIASSEAHAKSTSERVLKIFDDPVTVEGRSYDVGGSLGLAVRHGAEPKSLNMVLQVADVGLYQAKAAGKGTYRLRSLIH